MGVPVFHIFVHACYCPAQYFLVPLVGGSRGRFPEVGDSLKKIIKHLALMLEP